MYLPTHEKSNSYIITSFNSVAISSVLIIVFQVKSKEFSAVKHKFPMITVRTYAIRRAGFFLWNILAIMVSHVHVI